MTLFFLFKLPTFPFLASNATAQRMVLIQNATNLGIHTINLSKKNFGLSCLIVVEPLL